MMLMITYGMLSSEIYSAYSKAIEVGLLNLLEFDPSNDTRTTKNTIFLNINEVNQFGSKNKKTKAISNCTFSKN